jgi:MinD superfamily P-loop ATPase
LGIPAGVVVNRAGIGDTGMAEFCRTSGLEILAEIPDSREVAEIYSDGYIIAEKLPDYAGLISGLLGKLAARAGDAGPGR